MDDDQVKEEEVTVYDFWDNYPNLPSRDKPELCRIDAPDCDACQ